jgi:transposase
MIQTTRCDFSGQHFFIGIDTHKSNWRVTIRCGDVYMKTFSMDPDPLKLKEHMHHNYPGGSYHCVYEAGFCGYWIHRALESAGFKSVIVNPSDVPTTNKEKDRKDDPIDSNKLSRELCNGSLKGIYIPHERMESIRILSRCRYQYARRSTQVKNRIKSLLHFSGVGSEFDVYTHWSRMFINHLTRHEFNEKNTTFTLQQHLKELEHIRTMKLNLYRQIRSISREEAVIGLLRTIPGIGLISAFTLFAELVDIRRFDNLDHLASYVGLVPSISKSDTTEVIRGITNRQCKHLRYMLIEAAWIAVRRDPTMTHCFMNLTNGKFRHTRKTAIIRITKKLLNRIRAVWMSGKPYVSGVVAVGK